MKRVLTKENLYALGLAIIIILLVMVTADVAPNFIYEGF